MVYYNPQHFVVRTICKSSSFYKFSFHLVFYTRLMFLAVSLCKLTQAVTFSLNMLPFQKTDWSILYNTTLYNYYMWQWDHAAYILSSTVYLPVHYGFKNFLIVCIYSKNYFQLQFIICKHIASLVIKTVNNKKSEIKQIPNGVMHIRLSSKKILVTIRYAFNLWTKKVKC